MKQITITDASAADLLAAARSSAAYQMAPATKSELISLLAPPIVAPPVTPPVSGDWRAAALAASVAAGHDKTMLIDWDWAANVISKLDTSDLGGLGQLGVLIVRFVPTAPADNVLAQVSTVGYPANSAAHDLLLTISDGPDGAPLIAASDSGPSPTVRYVIGRAPVMFGRPSAASLTPGVPYYISVSGRDLPSGGANYDVRLSLGKPAGH